MMKNFSNALLTKPVSLISSIFIFAVPAFIVTSVQAETAASQLSNSAPIQSMIPSVPNIDAEAYILMDYNTGKVLAESNADSRRDPASLTKMMTSYVIGQALNAGKIQNEQRVNISKDAWATGNPIFKGSSLMFLKPGDEVTVAQLSRGISLQSGNDACVAIAEHIAGSQSGFVGLMNRYVESLGLKNTHFETVHGLDAEGQYSTARDMALIGQALIRDVPEEYAIYQEKEFTYNGIKQLNRNGLLWDKTLQYDGIKTGHTSAAGYNLVASAKQGEMRLISAVLGGRTYAGREQESKKLQEWGFRFFETVTPLKAEMKFATEQVWFGKTDIVELGVAKDVFLTIPRGRLKDLKASYVLTNPELKAPLKKDQIVGAITFQLDGNEIAKTPLVATKAVQESGFISRGIDRIKLSFHHWFG